MALPCLAVAYSRFFKKFNTRRFPLGKNRLPRDHKGISSIEKIIRTEAINIGGLPFELQFLGVLVQKTTNQAAHPLVPNWAEKQVKATKGKLNIYTQI